MEKGHGSRYSLVFELLRHMENGNKFISDNKKKTRKIDFSSGKYRSPRFYIFPIIN